MSAFFGAGVAGVEGASGAGAVMVGDEHDDCESGELVWEDAKDEQVPAQSGRSD